MSFEAEQRRVATPDEVVSAFSSLSASDQLRLRQLARLRALGLTSMTWEDLLHEALYRTLAGTRLWPMEISLVAFLAQTMRSIASEERVRASADPVALGAEDASFDDDGVSLQVQGVDYRTPEVQALARSSLKEIERLFASDSEAMQILLGIGEGLSPSEIQDQAGMSPVEYASAQKRIQRALARKFGR